jgi:NADPH-dependent 2,4-dienoyl-CoA reductase/sulfur reductase-like enzyme
MTVPQTIVVVGASLAGLRAVEALRRLGYDGRLVLVGAEPHRPYDRPPLSKEVLRGTREPDRIALAKPEAFDTLDLDLRLGTRATAVDLRARVVVLEDGERLDFDGLLVATGATPRTLPGSPPIAGLHTLRTLDDCIAIRAELERGPRVAVVGAGFIGAEVAATCRQRGLDVTLIETLPVPMAATLGMEIGEICAAVHRDQGVDLRCGVRVEGLEGSDRVERVQLSDGSHSTTDSCATRRWRPRRASSPPGTLRAGPTRCSGRRCGSSTGPTPSSRARRRASACWRRPATRSLSPRCPSSGPTSTTSRSNPPA